MAFVLIIICPETSPATVTTARLGSEPFEWSGTRQKNRDVGRFLAREDHDFAADVTEDIEAFAAGTPRPDSVLVFPPVSNFRRFLIHRTAEELKQKHKNIVTFSIGQGDDRRTVVCYDHQLIRNIHEPVRKMVVESYKPSSYSSKKDAGGESSSSCHPPQTPQQQPNRENPSRVRRPDRAVYVPRARRSEASTASVTTPPVLDTLPNVSLDSPAGSSKSIVHNVPQPSSSNSSPKERTPVTPKSKRSIDRSFCNVYKPPHARCSESNGKCMNDSESLSRTKLCESSRKVPKKAFADDLVPKLECSQPPLVDTSEQVMYKQSANESAAVDCAIDSSIDYKENSDLIVTPENVSQGSLLDNNSIIENGFDDITDIVPNSEHINNIAIDSQEYVNSNEYFDVHSHSLSNNVPLNCDLNMEVEKTFDYILQPVPDVDVNSSTNPDIIENSNENAWNNDKDEDKEEKELKKASKEINRSNRRLMKQSFVSDVLIISDSSTDKKQRSPDTSMNCEEYCNSENNRNAENRHVNTKIFNPDEEDWEAMIDDNGEWLPPQLMDELTATVGKVSIQKPRMSYNKYQTAAMQAFSHVLEIYDFPTAFTTNDLLSVLSDFKDTGFEIKWVDDNHALAVFSSTEIAAEVLAYKHPMVKTRPLHEATHESRTKAKKCAEFLQPYRTRPETCMALARRLVTGALGVRLPTQSQERLEEKEKLSIAREKKRLAAKHREAAWDGSLGES